ncbi:hypothetical protein [Xanthomonas bundabergensis]|uniref:hypothetical protein n=1 Tax=Xanthomonas bundabergensis TaxID=3160842 RepID=UPI003513D971
MDLHDHPTFAWVQFAEGRARFSGLVRGVDELGHETFAVEVDGNEFFGEIRTSFLPNGNDYNIEVVSFGYGSEKYLGMPIHDGCQIFSQAQINTIRTLIVQLIAAGTRFSDRLSLLTEYPSAHFKGDVNFRDGWALAADEGITPDRSRQRLS